MPILEYCYQNQRASFISERNKNTVVGSVHILNRSFHFQVFIRKTIPWQGSG